MAPKTHLVTVFAAGPSGGNPAPIVAEAAGMTDADMQAIARGYGHESSFVLPAPAHAGCDFALRFWVPNHEMEMCGHATVGSVWLLAQLGRLPREQVTIWTASGRVEAHIAAGQVEISQPPGRVETVDDPAAILSVLGIGEEALAPLPVQNACTSRVKTLVPLRSVADLDALQPDFARMEAVCAGIGSTGLYPYAAAGDRVFAARQFPRASGYPEDPATGIAAAALAFGLLQTGSVTPDDRPIRVLQGQAMGRPSEITVRFRMEAGQIAGCWLGGAVEMAPAG